MEMNNKSIKDIIHNIKENKPVSRYLESEHRNFAIYTLQSRAIPFFNGLKPVQQRCLWQLRNVNKFEKVAKLTGMVMSLHPHGDCLDYDTEVLLEDGSYIKIGDWVENNPNKEMTIIAYDREKEEFVKAKAQPTNGKVVDELIEIEFENGAKIISSSDHKFLLSDGQTYTKAEDLKEGDEIFDLRDNEK